MQVNKDSVKIRETPCSNKTNYTEHGKTRMQVNKDSVKIRETPCSNKTNYTEHTEKHGCR